MDVEGKQGKENGNEGERGVLHNGETARSQWQ